MSTRLQYTTYIGNEITPYIEDLVRFRSMLFREYPMLYGGVTDFDTHLKYLHKFLHCPDSVMILAREPQQNKVVGISTATPLMMQIDQLIAPFIEKNFCLTEVFYFQESMVLPAYRGLGSGDHFFNERERMARQHPGIKYLALDAVERDDNDERKPKDYKSPYDLWRRHGFERRDDMSASFHWTQVDRAEKSLSIVRFWIKDL